MPHQLGDQRRDVFGQRVREGGIVGDMDLADAGDLGGGGSDAVHALAGDEQMHLTQLRRGGDGGQRGILDGGAVMFDPDERLHFATPMDLSLPTSASTSATFTPAVRLAGSTTFSVVSRGVTSTPKSAGVFCAIGLDFAFMMFGSEA